MTTARRRRRTREQATSTTFPMAPQPRHPGILYTSATDENVERIHQKSMQILSEVGIAFLDDEAQAILRANGVKVVDDIAYFDPAHVEELIARAPSKFTLRARDPQKSIVVGEDYIAFSPVAGPPFTYDLDRGRRESTMADFVNFL
ncbi:MAG: trimethylamine methyltransferase family protein, partial [Chloroflexota bacterium]